MEGFTSLNINLDGDEAWLDLEGKKIYLATISQLAVLPDGTSRGKPAVLLRGETQDGETVMMQTTWNLLYTAAKTIEARYGPSTD